MTLGALIIGGLIVAGIVKGMVDNDPLILVATVGAPAAFLAFWHI